MGKQEETKSCMSEKEKPPSAPRLDQTNVHVYPDWAATQAYYGPGVPFSYYNCTAPPGYPPHPYMWGPPQAMMPPYGSPYAAAYPHGGVYAHPAVPLAPTPVSAVETPTKSTVDGPTKKLKSCDRFVITASSGNSDTAENEGKQQSSESTETEDPSDASNDMGVDQNRRKRSHGGTPLSGGGKTEGGTSSDGGAASAQPIVVGHPKMPAEAWMNEKELKRERRKQSNRESARRSRLRKQAEAEELANRVGALSSENMALTSEINQLTEDSERLRCENALLMEKLKNPVVQEADKDEFDADSGYDNGRPLQVTTENLLSRVNNSGGLVGVVSSEEDEGNTERNRKGSNKLKQLLDTKPISNAVRAS